MKVIADHIQTESMDRSDLCPMHQRFLSLQPFIMRILLQPLAQCLSNSFLHLPGCCFGECGDQQSIHIHRVLLICDQGDDPFHKHCCLARTGCG